MPVDYGPVPVSRLKDESGRIFDALSARRRVLVSRHGKVVAAIEPASPYEHREELAAFAVETAPAPSELTATDFGQGSPSRFIRKAEGGQSSLVTRGNKVFGVLTRTDDRPNPADPAVQEQVLAEFERNNPDATPAEFAQAVEAVTTPSGLDAEPEFEAAHGDVVSVDATEFDDRLLSEALVMKGIALERTQHLDDAKEAFASVIHQFGDEQDWRTLRTVAQSRVGLARIYLREGRSKDALLLTEQAIGQLERVAGRPPAAEVSETA